MKPSEMATMSPMRSIAWDGVSFPVPETWDLSHYEIRRGVTTLTLEDDVAVRLQIEWLPRTDQSAEATILRRHADFSERISKAAASDEPLGWAPSPWVAHRYEMGDGRCLATALYLGGAWPLGVMMRVHFDREDSAALPVMLRRLLDGFRFHGSGAIPWRVFDLAMRVPRQFTMTDTSFLAGRKLIIFDYRMRRLLLWRLSLVDRLLRQHPAAAILADMLNRSKDLAGVRFEATPEGAVHARRQMGHPFGHAEEIGRWCFRYHVAYKVDMGLNALWAMVYQYRREADLEWIRDVVLTDDSPLQ